MTWINRFFYLFIVVYSISIVITIYFVAQGLYPKKVINPFYSNTDSFVDITIKSSGNYLRHLSLITPQSLFSYGFDYQPFQPESLIYKRELVYQNYPFVIKIR